MKKIILFLMIVFIQNTIFAQDNSKDDEIKGEVVITTSHITYYERVIRGSDTLWVFGNEIDESSMFKFNENLTVIKHITNDITSTYYIKNAFQYEGVFNFEIVSDVGNNYRLVVNYQKEKITIVFDNESTEVVYKMKKYWINETKDK